MKYSKADIFYRIKAVLPDRWFGANTPVLDAVIDTLASGWVGAFHLLDYVVSRSRIATMSDAWLDMLAWDFFGSRVVRRNREDDPGFRTRIRRELLRDRCTRDALSQGLLALTGRHPKIFEPGSPRDAGGWGSLANRSAGSGGYNTTGGWGNLELPFQVFVTAYLPVPSPSTALNGWNGALGAFGAGISAYGDSIALGSGINADSIYQEVLRTAPAGTTIWVSIET